MTIAMLKDRRFTLDGEPIEIDAFLQANPELAEVADEFDRIVLLQPGESITYGGGAAATFTLTRTA